MSKPTSLPSRIILTGFSGTGKSAVAPILAARLGWEAVDTDALVERRAGKPILDIFRDDGEQAFRDLEAEAVREVCARERIVLATGGGAVLRPENRRTMAEGGFVVCLEALPETILARLQARSGEDPLDRPLLATADPLPRIRELKEGRQHLYALCDWAVQTDALTAEEIAVEVLRAYESMSGAALAQPGRVEAIASPEARAPTTTLHAIPQGAACMVRTAVREYPVLVGWDALAELGRRLRDAGLGRYAYVISDEAVFHHLGGEVEKSLRSADVPFDSYTIPPGEASKSLKTAAGLYDWLIQRRAERGHAIVAIGGGVVTDLAGYVAATYARGLPLVHVPTSLLAMVDAAIGGKVGVNHPQAKNMIGAFYQPRFVLAGVAALRTLPPRELWSGWAEVVKHGFIAAESLVTFLEDRAEHIGRLDPEATTEAIRRSVCIKAQVVSEDEFETLGPRTTLNYGHTLAHAMEATTGYTRFLHGEAVAIGMMAAAAMSVRLGLVPPAVAERQRRLLERYRLPVRAEGLDRERLRAAMALDKKVEAGAIRWVLLEGIGRPVMRDDVPADVVEAGLDEVLR
ncbi:MAG: 3-dehydroquinate synthase [Dehalococcoidia bacterium]|nr:3-dehydroquinate synthase [Dehalococcoidia bacterium]